MSVVPGQTNAGRVKAAPEVLELPPSAAPGLITPERLCVTKPSPRTFSSASSLPCVQNVHVYAQVGFNMAAFWFHDSRVCLRLAKLTCTLKQNKLS